MVIDYKNKLKNQIYIFKTTPNLIYFFLCSNIMYIDKF